MTPNQATLLDNLTIDERARAIGLKTYDTALPQDWFDTFMSGSGGWNPAGQIVWSYDHAPFLGEPIAVTAEAQHRLRLFYEAH